MNQQSADTDGLLRAAEDQSLPDLSHIDLHWQGMKNLLVIHSPAGIQKVIVNPRGLIFSFAVMLVSCMFIIVTSRPSASRSLRHPISKDSIKPDKTIQPADTRQDTIPASAAIKMAKQPAQSNTIRLISSDTVLTSGTLLEIRPSQSATKLSARYDTIRIPVLTSGTRFEIRVIQSDTSAVNRAIPVKTSKQSVNRIRSSNRRVSKDSVIHN